MMRIAEALAAFKPHRGDAIVVPGRGGRFWVELTGNEKLDVPLGDPAMGGHAGFALGLALARPERKVVLFDSEGDILMSLGMLTDDRRAGAGQFLSLPLGQRGLRHDRRPASAQRQERQVRPRRIGRRLSARAGVRQTRRFRPRLAGDFQPARSGLSSRSRSIPRSRTRRSAAACAGTSAAARGWSPICSRSWGSAPKRRLQITVMAGQSPGHPRGCPEQVRA